MRIRGIIQQITEAKNPEDEEIYYRTGQARLVYEDEDIKIVKINSYQAAKYFSSGSRGRSNPWCISNKKNYEDYEERGYDWHF